jgi:hypothetical protein
MIKRFLSRISPKTRVAALTLLAAVVVGVGVAWIVARATQPATSQETGPAAIIPTGPPLTPPFVKPSVLPTMKPGAVAPGALTEEERSLEPPPGALPTPSTAVRNAATSATRNVPEGWTVYDNPKFQYTFALPPDWVADMRPEGGQFGAFDPTALANGRALANDTTDELQPGGVGMVFVGRVGRGIDKSSLVHTAEPNTSFGDYPGAIWEDLRDADKEYGIAKMILFAFRRGDIMFEGDAKLREGYSESDVTTVYQIFNTITPY